MNDPMNYYRGKRRMARIYRNGQAPLTQDELDNIKSLNDRISMQDVRDIYVPLAHLIYLYMKEFESLFLSKGLFLHKYVEVPPFIIGIAGSVAVGKVQQPDCCRRFVSYLQTKKRSADHD